MRPFAALLGAAGLLLAGCGNGGREADVCANADHELDASSFVFVQTPTSGERVSSGFRVSGCASTFEANVTWRLRARDGHTLASGFVTTKAGSLRPGPFRFRVAYSIRTRQIGLLEVVTPSTTTEGNPPVNDFVPLALAP
jgi:hypothetical protein